ncbi:MAG: hypothetical protein Q8O57_08860, partial [Kiritimatiellota bacterium]|nr:hypothetical protein [Kiritimatiellota bacterium]
MDTRLEELLELLNERLGRLRQHHKIAGWKFDCELEAGRHAPVQIRVEGSSWLEWDGDSGTTWMRANFEFPGEVAGIPVAGSRATLESHGHLTRATVMLDGRAAMDSPYWAEIRTPQLVLSASVKPGAVHEIAVRFDRWRGVIQMSDLLWINYDSVEEVILDLGSFAEELRFAARCKEGADTLRRIGALWEKRKQNTDWPGLRSFVAEARQDLAAVSAAIKEHVVHLVGHAHIDMNWQWGWDDTVETCRRDFDTMTQMMAEFPDLTFSQSQAVLYQLAEKRFPDIFARVKAAVLRGQWD